MGCPTRRLCADCGGAALGEKAEDNRGRPRRRRKRIFALWVTVAALLLIEAVSRLKTQAVNGGLRLNGIDLLPLPLVTESRRRALIEDHPYLVADEHCGWTIRPCSRSSAEGGPRRGFVFDVAFAPCYRRRRSGGGFRTISRIFSP